MQCKGVFFDGRSTRPRSAVLDLDQDHWILQGLDSPWQVKFPQSQGQWDPVLGQGERILRFEPMGEFRTQNTDHPLIPKAGINSRIEAKWSLSIGALLLLIGLALGLSFWGLPLMAKATAYRIPMNLEVKLGEQSLEQLENQWIYPSRLPAAQIQRLDKLNQILHSMPNMPEFRLILRSSPIIGPNAFALPGGTIVVTDEMMQKSQDQALLGVLAHEAGHLQQRHALRGLLQQMGFMALLSTLSGDLSGLYHTTLTFPAALMQMSYSRDFEYEADAFAAHALKSQNRSIEPLIQLLADLGPKDSTSQNERQILQFLQSHPMGEDRAQALRRAWK